MKGAWQVLLENQLTMSFGNYQFGQTISGLFMFVGAIHVSAHSSPTYLNRIELGTARQLLVDHLVFHKSLAEDLQKLDRVHTYAGFHIADVRT